MSRADLLRHLLLDLDTHHDPHPARAEVTGLRHSLLTATRLRTAGADSDLIALGLLHDTLHVLAPTNHGEALATILSDRLNPGRQALLAAHSVWQHDAIHGTTHRLAYHRAAWWDDAELLGWADAGAFNSTDPADLLSTLWPHVTQLLGE